MSGKARLVKWQKLRDVDTKPFTGDKSPYWDWVKTFGLSGEEGELREYSVANPDLVACEDEENTPSLNGRAVMLKVLRQVKLSKGERTVLEHMGRGLNEVETAEALDMTRRHVRVVLSRIQKKCEKIFVAISRDSRLISGERDIEEEL